MAEEPQQTAAVVAEQERWRRQDPIESTVTFNGQPFLLVQAGPQGGTAEQVEITYPNGDTLATLHEDLIGMWSAAVGADHTPLAESMDMAVRDVLGLWAVDAGRPLAEAHPYRADGDVRASAVMATEVRRVLEANRARITSAAAAAWPYGVQNPEFLRFDAVLASVLNTVTEQQPTAASVSGARELSVDLDTLRGDAERWRRRLTGAERRAMGFALAQLMGQAAHLDARIRRTMEQIETPQTDTGTPSPQQAAELNTAAVPQPQQSTDQGRQAPSRQEAAAAGQEAAPAVGPGASRLLQVAQARAAEAEPAAMSPAEATAGDRNVQRVEEAARQAAARARPELPLWTGTELPPGRWQQDGNILSSEGAPVWRLRDQPSQHPDAAPQSPPPAEAGRTEDLAGALDAALQAWQDHVPADRGTPEDLRAALAGDLRILDEALDEARAARPTTRATEEEEASGPAAAADAVNAALEKVDQQADFKDSPEWQRLQTIRGAARHLWDTLKEKAGAYWHKLSKDSRFQGFWKNLSIRICEKIAEIAIKTADKLSGATDREVPTADALLALGDASLSYSSAARTEPTDQAEAPEAETSAQQAVDSQQVKEAAAPAPAAQQPAAAPEAPRATQPYASRDDAVQATHDVVRYFQAWTKTPMGQDLLDSSHPKLVAFRDAWKALPEADLPTGPAPAAAAYSKVADTALSLARRAAVQGRFAEADLKSLRVVADTAKAHAERLAATHSGTTGSAASATAASPRAAVPQAAAAQRQIAPRPRAAAATQPTARSPRASG